MQPRSRAALALLALLAALLTPAPHPHAGTTHPRVAAASPDAVPAARVAQRQQPAAAPQLDATTTDPAVAPAAAVRQPATVVAPAGSAADRTPVRTRGPPQV